MTTRSIPACTGKPTLNLPSSTDVPVYPRVYGETWSWLSQSPDPEGLSPRVRGNPHRPIRKVRPVGSIPACTGKPDQNQAFHPFSKVYPRVYGETLDHSGMDFVSQGLSPRVRGNRSPTRSPPDLMRSIPACTGKPDCYYAGCPSDAVYPRVYGETAAVFATIGILVGLSPRVRGNPLVCTAVPLGLWSIPACTGKPEYFGSGWRYVPVYPRVYGETCFS